MGGPAVTANPPACRTSMRSRRHLPPFAGPLPRAWTSLPRPFRRWSPPAKLPRPA